MRHVSWKTILQAWLAAAVLTGCTTRETIPTLCVAPTASGLETGQPQSHGPKTLLDVIKAPPDIPSGTSVSIRRVSPLHNDRPRYFVSASGVLEVVSLERPADYDTHSHGLEKDIRQWKRVLYGPRMPDEGVRRLLNNDQLREIPWVNAGRCFHAKLCYRTFPWGNALMFLTTYVQGNTGGPVNNDMLVLTVQGITANGRRAVRGHFAIRHPQLPDSSWDKKTRGKAIFDIDEEDAKAERWLDAQPDDSFEPTFARYEELLAALQVDSAPGR